MKLQREVQREGEGARARQQVRTSSFVTFTFSIISPARNSLELTTPSLFVSNLKEPILFADIEWN